MTLFSFGSAVACGIVLGLLAVVFITGARTLYAGTDPPQPQETPMDQIKLDPEVVRALSTLYAKVYDSEFGCENCKHPRGGNRAAALEGATRAVEAVIAAARPITLLPTTGQDQPKEPKR